MADRLPPEGLGQELERRAQRVDKPTYFQTALSSFVTETACGGAVRHLVDIGCTLDQICGRLDYPAPRSKVQRIMMEYLYEQHILLREEPSMKMFEGRTQFMQEQDAYGRRTMRKVGADYNSQNKMTNTSNSTFMSKQNKEAGFQDILWKESVYERGRDGKLTELLYRKWEENGEDYCYMSCAFALFNADLNGQMLPKEKQDAQKAAISCLNSRQREYLLGIRWEEPVLYHRLDQRMREILVKLYGAGCYKGACFFLKTQEKLLL